MIHTITDDDNLLMYSPRWGMTNTNTIGWTFDELISEMSINHNIVWLYHPNWDIEINEDFCCGLR